jgi:hypothetical protein
MNNYDMNFSFEKCIGIIWRTFLQTFHSFLTALKWADEKCDCSTQVLITFMR